MSNAHHLVVGKGVSINLDTDDCIPWPLRISPQGYGAKTDRSYSTRVVTAHRWVWEQLFGRLAPGVHLDHLCHNDDLICAGGVTCLHRRCVNIQHLQPVSIAENNARSKPYSRTPRLVCRNGHDLTVDDALTTYPSHAGRCKQCGVEASRNWQRRNREKMAGYQRAYRERIRSNEAGALDPDRVPRSDG